MTSIDREQWNRLRPQDEQPECAVTVRSADVTIESDDGNTSAAVHVYRDGVDVRVGDLQFIVKRQHVTVLKWVPPYPIREWVVLWEGDLS